MGASVSWFITSCFLNSLPEQFELTAMVTTLFSVNLWALCQHFLSCSEICMSFWILALLGDWIKDMIQELYMPENLSLQQYLLLLWMLMIPLIFMRQKIHFAY